MIFTELISPYSEKILCKSDSCVSKFNFATKNIHKLIFKKCEIKTHVDIEEIF